MTSPRSSLRLSPSVSTTLRDSLLRALLLHGPRVPLSNLKSKFATALLHDLWRTPACCRAEGRRRKTANPGRRGRASGPRVPSPGGITRTRLCSRRGLPPLCLCPKASLPPLWPFPFPQDASPLFSLFNKSPPRGPFPRQSWVLLALYRFEPLCCGQQQCVYWNPSCRNRVTSRT